MDLTTQHIEIGGKLSLFLKPKFQNPVIDNLRFVEVLTSAKGLPSNLPKEHVFLYDVILKLLQRGNNPFPSYVIEKKIIHAYGQVLGLTEKEQGEGATAIEYEYSNELIKRYNSFSAVLSAWSGDLADIPVDQEHPENERRLLGLMVKSLGPRLVHCLYPQFELESVLGGDAGADFKGQHGDFLIALPNGSSLIIEPGDHGKRPANPIFRNLSASGILPA